MKNVCIEILHEDESEDCGHDLELYVIKTLKIINNTINHHVFCQLRSVLLPEFAH